jgi:hypothetical protein
MNPEVKITITVLRDGKPTPVEVKMRYCAATETGFETLSGKSSGIFTPTPIEFDKDGNATKYEQPTAITDDYIKLGLAAIIAAYGRNDQTPPITAEDILFDASPEEVIALIDTIVKLRKEWYKMPDIVPASETDEKPEDSKNAQRPTRRIKRS